MLHGRNFIAAIGIHAQADVEIDVRREPAGAGAAIGPWSFPMAMSAWKIAPPLAYGNAVGPFGGHGDSSYRPRGQGRRAAEFYTTAKTACIRAGERA